MSTRPTRRRFLGWLGGATVGPLAFGGYACAIEPRYLLRVQRYGLAPAGWPAGLKLRIAALADLHAAEPYMPAARIEEIVATTQALQPDLVVLLGDYLTQTRFHSRPLPPREWAAELGRLKAPLGVHAILGNHDWWDDPAARRARKGPGIARRALEAAGIPVLENDAVRLAKGGRPFWLLGLADQLAFPQGNRRFAGLHDLPGTVAKITDDAPAILLAHEPDIFPKVPARVALTLSGHTHGGQVRLFGWSPVVPSMYGNRYAYGHIVEERRHMIVSGGLGTSVLPVRFGMPPEIVVVDLG